MLFEKFYTAQPGRQVLTASRYHGHFYAIFMFELYEEKNNPGKARFHLCEAGYNTYNIYIHITPRLDKFLIHAQQYARPSP